MKPLTTFFLGLAVAALLIPVTFVFADAAGTNYFPALPELRASLFNPEGITAWKTHINKTFKYTIGYPAQWKVKRFFPYLSGFQPPSMTGSSVQWAVLVIDEKSSTTLNEEIEKMGTQFKKGVSRVREAITINGVDAVKVTARTLEQPSWEHVQIFVRAYDKIYIITNGGIPNQDFTLFYSSFVLTEK